MKTASELIVPLIILLIVFHGLLGCSASKNSPTEPSQVLSPPTSERQDDSERVLWGVWRFYYDTATGKISAQPVRNLQKHFDITDMLLPPSCNDCICIDATYYINQHILDVDVTLRNPYKMSGYDVRGIVYKDDAGHTLLDPDGWTSYWDVPGGADLNPFMAFAKSEPSRKFAGEAEHTENFRIGVPDPPKFHLITYAVDASWPGNCKEPYGFGEFIYKPIYDHTPDWSSAVEVAVHSWPAGGEVNRVVLEAPMINGEQELDLLYMSKWELWICNIVNSEQAPPGIYKCWIWATTENSGDKALYQQLILRVTKALSPQINSIEPNSGMSGETINEAIITGGGFLGPKISVHLSNPLDDDIHFDNVEILGPFMLKCTDLEIPMDAQNGLWDVVVVNDCDLTGTGDGLFEVIEPSITNLVDITPEWLNFDSSDVTVSGDYAFIASYVDGSMHIFNIADPLNPEWVSMIELTGNCQSVTVDGNYVFAACRDNGLQIISITQIDNPMVAKIVDVGDACEVVVDSGYAYVAAGKDGLTVVDIDPVGTAFVVINAPLGPNTTGLAKQWNLLYLADDNGHLSILNVSNPEDPIGVKVVNFTVDTPQVAIGNGYAYMGVDEGNLLIVDIDPPGSAHVEKVIPFGIDPLKDIEYKDGYLYVCGSNHGLCIIDVDPVSSADHLATLKLPAGAGLCLSGDYAYVGDDASGLYVVDISNPASPAVLSNLYTPSDAYGVYKFGYPYFGVANGRGGFAVLRDDVSNPEVCDVLETTNKCHAVEATFSRAYVANNFNGLEIIEISFDSGKATLLKTIDVPGSALDIDYVEGKAYIANWSEGLQLMNVSPLYEAELINTVATPGGPRRVYVHNWIAFVADNSNGLQIIDVWPLEWAEKLGSCNTSGNAYGVYADYNYAYIAAFDGGLDIIDVGYLPLPDLINNVDTIGWAVNVTVRNNYAYVATYWGLEVIDISDPGTAFPVCNIELAGRSEDVHLVDNLAYVACTDAGLRIIELW